MKVWQSAKNGWKKVLLKSIPKLDLWPKGWPKRSEKINNIGMTIPRDEFFKTIEKKTISID